MQGLGKGGAGGRGTGEEEEQERGKEKRNKEEKMRNGLDEELGVLQDGRRMDRAEGCLATSVWPNAAALRSHRPQHSGG